MFALICTAQNYAWGKVGLDSIVGRIHNSHYPEQEAQTITQPFAEYWMGAHVNGPSKVKIDASNVLLAQIINNQEFMSQHDGQEVPISDLFQLDGKKFLGSKYVEEFESTELQYLFKVLSVRTALSIQAHPNKALAEKLHVRFPDIYKDPNHKPEIAIALGDDFVGCYGFTSRENISKNLSENPLLAETFPTGENGPDEQYLHSIVLKMFMELDLPENKEQLTAIITGLQAHIQSLEADSRSTHQQLCLTLIEQYGTSDIGILFTFFLNVLSLKRGESFVISPDEPHAYIAGDLVEAMISSDNVVRGGLTPKLKDTETLKEVSLNFS